MKSIQLKEDNAWFYDSNEFCCMSKFRVANVAASKDRRRRSQDVKIRVFALCKQSEADIQNAYWINIYIYSFCTIL